MIPAGILVYFEALSGLVMIVVYIYGIIRE